MLGFSKKEEISHSHIITAFHPFSFRNRTFLSSRHIFLSNFNLQYSVLLLGWWACLQPGC
nr:MAG TPA: hypothetical protein [Caudoviricetes sp.]